MDLNKNRFKESFAFKNGYTKKIGHFSRLSTFLNLWISSHFSPFKKVEHPRAFF